MRLAAFLRALLRWKRSYGDWSKLTSAERALAEQLTGDRFLYRRVGHDQRFLHFQTEGRIGEGAAGLERRWCVAIRCDEPVLVISGDAGPTVVVRRGPDGVWRGRWRRFERMQVELIPTRNLPLAEPGPERYAGRRPLFIAAPAGRMSGYGNHARHVIRGLLARNAPVCLNGLYLVREDLEPDLQDLVFRPRGDDWHLIVSPPDNLEAHDLGPRSLVLTTAESETLPAGCVRELNRAALVVVPCRWNRDCFLRSGVTARVETVGEGHDPSVFRPGARFPDICAFGFAAALTGGGARKNVDGLVEAFRQAFPRERNVRLRLKLTPRCPFPDRIADRRVEILKAYLTESDLAAWYASLTAFVNPSRGEAWGLHLLEAMACGRPVISTFYSGVMEYLDESVGYPVDYRLVDADSDLYRGWWAEPDIASLAARLRQVHADPDEARRRGGAAAARAAHFTWERMTDQLVHLLSDLGALPAEPLAA